MSHLIHRLKKNIVHLPPWLLSDRKFVELQWELRYGKKLDLEHPVTFNEKMQWLKVFDHRNDYFLMADKIEAKKFAESVIGKAHIIPTIAVYDKVDDIDWASLPDRFVLKCSHDSGGLAICRDKEHFDVQSAKDKLRRSLHHRYYYQSREWCYKGIKPRLLCEKYMTDEKQTDSLTDYKFFCFNGKPEFLYISYGLEDHSTASISFADMDGRRLPFARSDFKEIEDPLPIPESFVQMKEIATGLAEAVNNRFIRVDLYDIGGTVYFSELTFYPNGGFVPFRPTEWDARLGELLRL